MNRTGRLTTALLLLLGSTAARAALIDVAFLDANGEGFYDTDFMVFAPGNSSPTRGGQRQNVVNAAVAFWEKALGSDVAIHIDMAMDELQPCNASGGILGHAGPTNLMRDFPGAPVAATYYTQAEANSLASFDLDAASVDIEAAFNSLVDGDSSCFTTTEWWYGIGVPAPPGKFDFYRVVLHEIGHGLGLTTVVNLTTGVRPGGYNDAYMRRLEDHPSGKSWPQMTDAERVASAKSVGNLHWTGPAVAAVGSHVTDGLGASGHLEMYAPSALALGSSVTHWSNDVTPNEIMEPFLTPDGRSYLTLGLLRDIGWEVNLIFADDFEQGNASAWLVH